MENYKSQLRRHLADRGWEVEEVIASDVWWADEYWKVKSHRNLWGFEITLTFLVDPHWEAPRKKGQGIWAISATEDLPPDRLAAEQGIALLVMLKGRFNMKLQDFVAALDADRNMRSRQSENPVE